MGIIKLIREKLVLNHYKYQLRQVLSNTGVQPKLYTYELIKNKITILGLSKEYEHYAYAMFLSKKEFLRYLESSKLNCLK